MENNKSIIDFLQSKPFVLESESRLTQIQFSKGQKLTVSKLNENAQNFVFMYGVDFGKENKIQLTFAGWEKRGVYIQKTDDFVGDFRIYRVVFYHDENKSEELFIIKSLI